MDDILLNIKNLHVHFHSENERVHAVDGLSFTLSEGQTMSIVGESGSGKSVSALSIMQLLGANAVMSEESSLLFIDKGGRQLELNDPSGKNAASVRGSQIGMIFQEPMTSLNPLMRCGEQVAETIRLHLKMSEKEAELKTLEIFDEVKLPNPTEIFIKYPHEISGGQKQRVMIAMAISCNPKLLIADEPTTALDVTVQKSILRLLKEIQQKHRMAILFITHDLNLVKSFADTVLVMYKGKSVEFETAKNIFSIPKHPYTQSLLNCRPDKGRRVKFLATVAEINSGENKNQSVVNTISHQAYQKRIADVEGRNPILEIKDLHVWYPNKSNFLGKPYSWFKAVNGVDMMIREGETMGLVGESGCGKTTIGKAIVKLCDITSGEIRYKGKNINDFSKSELKTFRREVQIIFQDPYSSLNPRMSIGAAIREPMDVHGIENSRNRKAKAISLLEKVGLNASHYNRYPHEFSGGQRQRICIARALALNANFIICDESVSALDVSVQAQVLNLLVSLREEFEFTCLFISHDLNVIKHISDHVTVMQKGSIVEQNDAEELYRNPGKEYTKTLIGSLEL